MKKRILCTLLTLVVILLAFAGCAKTKEADVQVSVSQMLRSGEELVLELTLENRADFDMRLGWTSSPKLVVKSEEDTYRKNLPIGTIDAGDTATLTIALEDFQGLIVLYFMEIQQKKKTAFCSWRIIS